MATAVKTCRHIVQAMTPTETLIAACRRHPLPDTVPAALLVTIANALEVPTANPAAGSEDPLQAAIDGTLTGTATDDPNRITVEELNLLPIYKHYRYGNTLGCSGKEAEHQAFDAYVQVEGKRPADKDTLRAWVTDTPNPRT